MKETGKEGISGIIVAIADDIDRLITIDVPLRGVIKVLYQAARKKSPLPLTLHAAVSLRDRVKPGDVVFLATGWPDRPWVSPDIGENDGPVGAAVLARAVHLAYGALPVILIEDRLKNPMQIVLQSAGLKVVSPEDAGTIMDSAAPLHAASVLDFPADTEAAGAVSKSLVQKYRPSAVIAIEKGGMNDKGVIHNLRGNDTSKEIGKADLLVREAKKSGILTIGIGDGGNEIGMGNIRDVVRENVLHGKKCLCPCGGGIAPVTETDVLVPATVSNWGAYGISASLALIRGNYEVFHNAAIEKRMLESCAEAGLIDGMTGYVEESVDGLSSEIHEGIVNILAKMIRKGLEADKGNMRDEYRTYHSVRRRQRGPRSASDPA